VSRLVKITVLLEPSGFERLDDYCRKRGFKKSTLIARLIRDHLDGEDFEMQAQLPLEDLTVEDRGPDPTG
jgi:hypothetical protein